MKKIPLNTSFPLNAPGGDRYEWKEAFIGFKTSENGKYLIEISASAFNGEQNGVGDDDDLRIELDGYRFGKYEDHPEKISWHGFGTTSSWNGASLKGESKTIFFFVELLKGDHEIKFFADNAPTINHLKIYKLIEGEALSFNDLKPIRNIKTNKKGIPFISFIFLGVKPENFEIKAICQSGKQKESTDGDNVKVITHKKLYHNPKAPTSDKYKNFYFSGDIDEGLPNYLRISLEELDFVESSVELYYDEDPQVDVSFNLLKGINDWRKGVNKEILTTYYKSVIGSILYFFDYFNLNYCHYFLKHLYQVNPKNLTYGNNDDLTKLIKNQSEYQKILKIIENQIKIEGLKGQIVLGDKDKGLDIKFENNKDLKYSIHGLHKIEYRATNIGDKKYEVSFDLFDVYDFSQIDLSYDEGIKGLFIVLGNNEIDKAGLVGILKDYEIIFKIEDVITIE